MPITPKDWTLSRARGIDGVIDAHKLDALLTPGGSGAGLAARAGYPIIVVPFGLVPNAPTPCLSRGFRRQARAMWRRASPASRAASRG